MKQTFYIKTDPTQVANTQIFVGKGSRGFVENNELHLITDGVYFVHKFSSGRWYMRNDVRGTDHFVGVGACPAIVVENIEVQDAEYWGQITFDPTHNEE